MELSSSDKERIQHQYDALAKKTLVGEAKSYRRTLAKRAAREVTFSDLSESELAQLFTTDEYESDYYRFQAVSYTHLIPVTSVAVPCSRYSQGIAGIYITRRLPFSGSRRILFSRLLWLPRKP